MKQVITGVLAGLLMLTTAESPSATIPSLTRHQQWALREAALAGAYYDDSRQLELEFDFTATLQAILGQESSWCLDKHDRDPESWGCGQLTVQTAQLFDVDATPHKLLYQDRYNIWLSATYLAYCRGHTHTWTDMLRCYHGWGSKDWQAYVKAIRQRIRNLPESED